MSKGNLTIGEYEDYLQAETLLCHIQARAAEDTCDVVNPICHKLSSFFPNMSSINMNKQSPAGGLTGFFTLHV